MGNALLADAGACWHAVNSCRSTCSTRCQSGGAEVRAGVTRRNERRERGGGQTLTTGCQTGVAKCYARVGSLVWRISLWKLLFDFLCQCISVTGMSMLLFFAPCLCVMFVCCICVRVCVRERGVVYVFDMRFQFWLSRWLSSLTRKEERRLSMTRLWSSSFKIAVSPVTSSRQLSHPHYRDIRERE